MASILDHASTVTEVRRRAIAQSDRANGIVLTQRIDSREPRRWRLGFSSAPTSVINELIRDVAERAFVAQSWTPPGEVSAISVIYSPPEVRASPASHSSAEVTVELEELLATD